MSTAVNVPAFELEVPRGKSGRLKPPASGRGEAFEKAREAFVNREVRPTYVDLSTEFAIPVHQLHEVASDHSWPVLRAQALQAQLEASGASEVIASALKSSRAIVQAGEHFSLVALRKLIEILESLKGETASSSRASVVNTVTFAYKNISDGCKSLGIVGFAKELNNAGKEGNGQWNPNLLNQINITVGKLESARSEVSADVI